MEYTKIEIDFVERTLKLLDEYNGDYEVTILINCCLGLLVLPKEKHFDLIPNEQIPLGGELWGLTRDSVTVDCESCGYILSYVIRRIRNGICHFKVKTLPNSSGEINMLEIKDGKKFKVVLTPKKLKEFTKSFANHVIKT